VVTKDHLIKVILSHYIAIMSLGTRALKYANIVDNNVITKVKDISEIAVLPVASVLFSLFAMMQVYKLISHLNDVGAPQGGSARIEVVGLNLAKLGIIYWAIRKLSGLMWGISYAGVYLMEKIEETGYTGTKDNIDEMETIITKTVNDSWTSPYSRGFITFEQMVTLNISNIVIYALFIIVFVLFYGRMFQIYIMIAVAPLPLVTLIHDEHRQVGISFIKSFVSVVLQGAVMMAIIYIYSTLSFEGIVDTSGHWSLMWSLVGIGVLLVVALATSGALTRRIVGAL
jgi:hypothetical protein